MPRHTLKAEILALAPVLLVTANTEFEREWGGEWKDSCRGMYKDSRMPFQKEYDPSATFSLGNT